MERATTAGSGRCHYRLINLLVLARVDQRAGPVEDPVPEEAVVTTARIALRGAAAGRWPAAARSAIAGYYCCCC